MTAFRLRHSLLALAAFCGASAVASAQSVRGQTNGLTTPTGAFDFNALPQAEGEALGSLLNNSVTVQFTSAYYGRLPSETLYGPFVGSFSDNAIYNYTFGQIFASSITLDFMGSPTSAVLFNYTTAVDPGAKNSVAAATFSAYSNGVLVSTFTDFFSASTVQSRALFWGFEFTDGTTFDKIVIQGNPNAFGLDNVQVRQPVPVLPLPPVTTVPEPGTVGLLALGLAGLGVVARRRGQRS